MAGEEKLSRNLPTSDVMLEIFSRLPSKSIARFRCLSKQWASTFASPHFTELFLTQSATRPRLLFAVERNDGVWCLYSCPQPQISSRYPNSSLSATAEFLMSFPKEECDIRNISAPILGLIYGYCFPSYYSPVLCNPSTRHVLRLPTYIGARYSYFGYDPIDKQFNVLAVGCYPSSFSRVCYYILKFGYGRVSSQRTIDCPVEHYPLKFNTCINGILYYIARFAIDDYGPQSHKIVSFDLNSGEFKFIDLPDWHKVEDILVNFKGKLGGITKKWVKFSKKRINLELILWVLEDIEKQEWSKHVYVLSSNMWNARSPHMSVIGMTATGEIVLSDCYASNPLHVYFFNFEKNILQKLEIKGFLGFKRHGIQYHCVDYVEDLKDRI